MKYSRLIIHAALALLAGTYGVTTAHAQETCFITTETSTTFYYYSDGTVVTVSWSRTTRICIPSET
jgi:hypothetical protein